MWHSIIEVFYMKCVKNCLRQFKFISVHKNKKEKKKLTKLMLKNFRGKLKEKCFQKCTRKEFNFKNNRLLLKKG